MPRATRDFEVVPHDEVPPATGAGRGQLSEASQSLLRGDTIFMTGKNLSARFSRMAKPRGYRVRTRAGARKGKQGTYLWLEPLETEVSI